nr:MAG TPA: hypothetical protein [Bacteriophage sp.]
MVYNYSCKEVNLMNIGERIRYLRKDICALQTFHYGI